MAILRTDLAEESFRSLGRDQYPGVAVNHWEAMGVTVTEVIVQSEEAAQQLGKPVGSYLTLESMGIRQREAEARQTLASLMGEELRRMLPESDNQPTLVIGLGNRMVTPDSLGPLTVDHTLVTRHMFEARPEYVDMRMKSVCALAPGVLGVTGVETFETVRALVDTLRPSCVIAVDSLCAGTSSRIGSTIQLADTGIQPGSGVGNHRKALTEATLGVKVIGVGVPMVIYAPSIARDAMARLPELADFDLSALDEITRSLYDSDLGQMIVTPREVDELVLDVASVLGSGINQALQPELSLREITEFMMRG